MYQPKNNVPVSVPNENGLYNIPKENWMDYTKQLGGSCSTMQYFQLHCFCMYVDVRKLNGFDLTWFMWRRKKGFY